MKNVFLTLSARQAQVEDLDSVHVVSSDPKLTCVREVGGAVEMMLLVVE